MVATRKRTIRRKRRTTTRRRFNISRPRTALRQTARSQVFALKRFVSGKVAQNGNDAVPSLGRGVDFQLVDVPAYTELSSLFDQYKITGVAYRFVISRDPMATNVTTKLYPRLTWVHDYDDASAPSSFNEIAQYPNCKEHWFSETRQHTKWHFIKPAKSQVMYESATLSGYQPTWKGFVDMASNIMPHYGIKMWWDYLQTGVTLYMQCKYYVVCKNVR